MRYNVARYKFIIVIAKREIFTGLLIALTLSCGDPKLSKHVHNIKKVKPAMTQMEVVAIMGSPDSVFSKSIEEDLFLYMYNVPLGMSDNIYIGFSATDSTVVRIVDGQ